MFPALFIATTCLGGCVHRLAEGPRPQGPSSNPSAPEFRESEDSQATSELELRRAASGIVGCRPEGIVIHDANYADFHQVWTLSCRSGHWICSRQDIPLQEYLHCSMLADGGGFNAL